MWAIPLSNYVTGAMFRSVAPRVRRNTPDTLLSKSTAAGGPLAPPLYMTHDSTPGGRMLALENIFTVCAAVEGCVIQRIPGDAGTNAAAGVPQHLYCCGLIYTLLVFPSLFMLLAR